MPTGLAENQDDALDTEILLAATGAGVMLSQDGGQTWTNESSRTGSGLPQGLGASDLVLATSVIGNGYVLYAAIPGKGVFSATLATTSQGLYGSTLVSNQLPLVWKAVDNGLNGVPTPYSGPTNLSQTLRILLTTHDGTDGDVVYAALVQSDPALQAQLGSNTSNYFYGIFRSADLGSSWQSMGVPADENGIVDGGGQETVHGAILADPSNPDLVYVSGDLSSGSHDNAIGTTVNNEPEGDVTSAIYTGPTTPTVWRSLVGYQSYSPVGGEPHADSRWLTIYGNYLFYASDGGIYRLNNPTLKGDDDPDWVSLNGNMFITEIADISYDYNSNQILAGTQDNGTDVQTDDGGLEWMQDGAGDGGDVAVRVTSDAIGDYAVYYYETENLGSLVRQVVRPDLSSDAFKRGFTTTAGVPLSSVSILTNSMGKPISEVTFQAAFVTDVVGSVDNLVLATANLLWESMDGGNTFALLPVYLSGQRRDPGQRRIDPACLRRPLRRPGNTGRHLRRCRYQSVAPPRQRRASERGADVPWRHDHGRGDRSRRMAHRLCARQQR